MIWTSSFSVTTFNLLNVLLLELPASLFSVKTQEVFYCSNNEHHLSRVIIFSTERLFAQHNNIWNWESHFTFCSSDKATSCVLGSLVYQARKHKMKKIAGINNAVYMNIYYNFIHEKTIYYKIVILDSAIRKTSKLI
jgi:hypothetical protein